MSFRVRLTLLTSLAVAVAIVGTSTVVYYTDRHELIRQMDSNLASSEAVAPLNAFLSARQVKVVSSGFGLKRGVSIQDRAGGGNSFTFVAPSFFHKQLVLPGSATAVQLQIMPRKNGAVATNKAIKTSESFSTETVGKVRSRVLAIRTPFGSVRISRSLAEVDRELSRLRWLLILISGSGVGVAAVLGAFVSGRAVAPLRKLTETTDRIVETGDLSERIGQSGSDEISRLSRRLDELLATLETSVAAQRQLVADASHELRTPIAALRANFELLVTPGTLNDGERADLLADVQGELESMTTLVGELVELARGEEQDVTPSDFRLDEVVQAAVDRAARRAPGLLFHTDLEPSVVVGVSERVDRAVTNLIDNACKWSPPGGSVDVSVHDGVVEVRDHGPGIAAEDEPLIFNRFYRSKAARGMPGAGLGLAIVKQIADAHGGSVSVDRAADGGAVLRLRVAPSP